MKSRAGMIAALTIAAASSALSYAPSAAARAPSAGHQKKTRIRSGKGVKRMLKRINMQAKWDEFVKEFERRHGENLTLRDATPRHGRHLRDFHMERWSRGLDEPRPT